MFMNEMWGGRELCWSMRGFRFDLGNARVSRWVVDEFEINNITEISK